MAEPDSDSESDSDEMYCSDDTRLLHDEKYIKGHPKDKIVKKKSENHPIRLQLDQFGDCLQTCYLFINHLLLVKEHKCPLNCRCPICRVMIAWIKTMLVF